MSWSERELIQIHHEWACSCCGSVFFYQGCVLDGPTPDYILQHWKQVLERSFTDHACLKSLQSEVAHDIQADSYRGR